MAALQVWADWRFLVSSTAHDEAFPHCTSAGLQPKCVTWLTRELTLYVAVSSPTPLQPRLAGPQSLLEEQAPLTTPLAAAGWLHYR